MTTLEELKERIRKNKLNQEIPKSPFSTFLDYYNFKKGLDKVPTYLLYYCYIRFIPRLKDYPPLTKPAFFRKLKTSLNSVRWGNQRYYLVDKSIIVNITEEIEFESKIYAKRAKVPKRTKQ